MQFYLLYIYLYLYISPYDPSNNISWPYPDLSSFIQVSFPVSVHLFFLFFDPLFRPHCAPSPQNHKRSMKGLKHHRTQRWEVLSFFLFFFFWRWQEVMADGRRGGRKRTEGEGGIHSFSQSPTVQLQSHLLSLWTHFFSFFKTMTRGAKICSSSWIRSAFLTPPAAPSSGDS